MVTTTKRQASDKQPPRMIPGQAFNSVYFQQEGRAAFGTNARQATFEAAITAYWGSCPLLKLCARQPCRKCASWVM